MQVLECEQVSTELSDTYLYANDNAENDHIYTEEGAAQGAGCAIKAADATAQAHVDDPEYWEQKPKSCKHVQVHRKFSCSAARMRCNYAAAHSAFRTQYSSKRTGHSCGSAGNCRPAAA